MHPPTMFRPKLPKKSKELYKGGVSEKSGALSLYFFKEVSYARY